MNKCRQAFTLIEISIVLAVIGLLVGGIVGGQALWKGQQLRKIGTDATVYMVAFNQFKQQYSYYPGDFPTAQSLWGRADGGAVATNCSNAVGSATPGAGTGTCNGDGNNEINGNQAYDSGGGAIYSTVPWAQESLRAWQHLTNAKLLTIPRLSGILTTPCCHQPGYNIPKGPLEESGFMWQADGDVWVGRLKVGSVPTAPLNEQYYDGDYSAALIFGKPKPVSLVPQWNDGPVLKPAELWELDRKLDDGMPAVGNIRTFKENSSAVYGFCAIGTTIDATYNVGYGAVTCPIVFMSTFAGIKTAKQ